MKLMSFRRPDGTIIEPAGKPNPPTRPLPQPPAGHKYVHPSGERFETKWLTFTPSPEECARHKAAMEALERARRTPLPTHLDALMAQPPTWD